MVSQLGNIVLDGETEKFMCVVRNPEERRNAAAVIRKLSHASGSLSVDGGSLVLDLPTALALRASPLMLRFNWSEHAARFIDTIAANYATIGDARRRIQDLQDITVAKSALAQYSRLDALDEHQIIAVAAMTDRAIRGLCLFDEQGTGKTVMAIHAFDYLRNQGERCKMVVFAPKNMVQEWGKDFDKFLGGKYVVMPVVGSRGEKYDALHERADVYVTNYETAHLLENPLRSLLNRSVGRVVMVVDESFFVKNRHTKRAAAVRRLRHLCDRCWVLCGTPAPNHALDVVHQFDVADGGITFGGIALPDNPQALRQAIQGAVEKRGIYLRRLKHDVMPALPGKRFERVAVPMEEEQRRLYTAALEGLVKAVQESTEAQFGNNLGSFLARRMALFELCSHPTQIVSSYHGTPGKLVALDSLVEELVGRQREKVVIWSFFRYSLGEIMRRYARFNPVRIDGTITDTQERALAISRFQQDDDTMIFVGNPAAAGAGITLTRARVAIYESFSVQAAHYLQSLDRIHRRGQAREVNYYMLLCQDSIEEDEYTRLLQKEQAARELFRDDDPRPLTRDVFLQELLSALRKL
jgi:SNF2 family DNA or RNA helicase